MATPEDKEGKKETTKTVAATKPAAPVKTQETKSVAQLPVQISNVRANFHLIVQPTKIFNDTDPDRVSLNINGEEHVAHVFDPFDNVSVVPKEIQLSPEPEKIPGYFRLTLFPVLRLFNQFNSNAENGFLKIGTAKETEAFYKELALALSKKVDAVMPNVSGYLTKKCLVNKASDDVGTFTWNIDIYAFYKYRGALPEDIIHHVQTVMASIEGKTASGKPNKTGPLPKTGFTFSIAVDIQEAYSIASGIDLSSFEYSTSIGESLYTPQTKTGRKELFGTSPYNSDDVLPLMIFTKESN